MANGLVVHQSNGGSRIEIACKHQNALVYIVPSTANWVCEDKSVHAHSLAGFLKDLFELDLPIVQEISQKWGIYYRERSLE